MSDLTIDVEGMTCAHCVNAVTGAVAAVPGVGDVDVNLDRGTVRVTGEEVDDSAVREAIVDAGYTPTT